MIRAIDSERQPWRRSSPTSGSTTSTSRPRRGADKVARRPLRARRHLPAPLRHLPRAPRASWPFHHPAMLYYLDNWLSVADGFAPLARPASPAPSEAETASPKEARLGQQVRPASTRTTGASSSSSTRFLGETTAAIRRQPTSRSAARPCTGWSIDQPHGRRDVRLPAQAARHDDAAKTILGKTFAAGGEQDGEQVLDLVASHPSTAKFLARKLCVKFVSDDPPASVVDHVADVFTKSGGDLKATYEAIIFSPEFWSDAADGTKTKTPLEVAASATCCAVRRHCHGETGAPAVGRTARIEPSTKLQASRPPAYKGDRRRLGEHGGARGADRLRAGDRLGARARGELRSGEGVRSDGARGSGGAGHAPRRRSSSRGLSRRFDVGHDRRAASRGRSAGSRHRVRRALADPAPAERSGCSSGPRSSKSNERFPALACPAAASSRRARRRSRRPPRAATPPL